MNLKFILIFIFVSIFSLEVFASYEKSVVRISSTLLEYDYKKPWAKAKEILAVGSGVVIENNYILTSAHVVSNAKLIRIKKDIDSKEYYAKVKYIYNQADLALLEVFDKNFFQNSKALKINLNIKKKDNVVILGYPKARKNFTMKNAKIKDIKYTTYSQSNEDLLVIELNNLIYSGNSGGPVLDENDNIVGIVMQKPRGVMLFHI